MALFPLRVGVLKTETRTAHDVKGGNTKKQQKNLPGTSSGSTSSSLSVGSGAFTNHHWISKYTDEVPLWKAHAISMFCPSLTVMLEGRSVKRPADERGKGKGKGGGYLNGLLVNAVMSVAAVLNYALDKGAFLF